MAGIDDDDEMADDPEVGVEEGVLVATDVESRLFAVMRRLGTELALSPLGRAAVHDRDRDKARIVITRSTK